MARTADPINPLCQASAREFHSAEQAGFSTGNQPRPEEAHPDAEEMLPPHRDPRFQLPLLARLAFESGGLEAMREHLRTSAAWHARTQRPHPSRRVAFKRRDQEVAWRMTGGRCFYCGTQLFGPNICEGGIVSHCALWIEVDHYVSRKLGGSSKHSNLRPSCRWCNQLKRGHSVRTFRRMFAREHGSPFFYGEIAS